MNLTTFRLQYCQPARLSLVPKSFSYSSLDSFNSSSPLYLCCPSFFVAPHTFNRLTYLNCCHRMFAFNSPSCSAYSSFPSCPHVLQSLISLLQNRHYMREGDPIDSGNWPNFSAALQYVSYWCQYGALEHLLTWSSTIISLCSVSLSLSTLFNKGINSEEKLE